MKSKERTLIVKQFFKQPKSELFPFFSDAKNLETITPPWLHFKILEQSTPSISQGTEFKYQLSLFGISVYWRSLISQWNPDISFVDEQIEGPYRRWHHVHYFENYQGGTVMTDRVDYALPFGPLGDVFGGLWTDKRVREIFEFRKQKLQEIFGHAL